MEHLDYRFGPFKAAPTPRTAPALAGVVSSGNMEVLIEAVPSGGHMQFAIDTSIAGFEPTWKAVVAQFAAQHPLADVKVSINDAGATPAVVALRLAQAIEEWQA
jgi:malonate decarboxylase delta subunit